MLDNLQTSHIAQLVIAGAVLAVIAVIGYYIARKFRDGAAQDGQTASDLLTNFREMHDEGAVSGDEYRTIKAELNKRLRNEINDNEETT